MKTKLSFILTLMSVIGFFILAFTKGVDVNTSIPTILGLFIAGRAVVSASHGWAASKDPNADTKATIDKLEEKD